MIEKTKKKRGLLKKDNPLSVGFHARFRLAFEQKSGTDSGAKTELAKSLGLSLRGVQQIWERVDTTPAVHKIERAARVLGVPPAWLAFGEGEKSE
jgi:transcriptional regulator with XRE-family HTH domain